MWFVSKESSEPSFFNKAHLLLEFQGLFVSCPRISA